MIKFYPILLSISLFSCFTPGQLDYLGTSYAPTKKIDVYVDASAIRKTYTVMGKSYLELHAFITLERVQEAAIQKAKEKGADAILFQDYIIQTGNSIETVSKVDTSGYTPVRIRTTTSAPVESSRLDILFLKYD